MSRQVLNPTLLYMEPNRIYRVNFVPENINKRPKTESNMKKSLPYTEEDLFESDDGEEEEGVVLEQLPNSYYKLTMHVPQALFPRVIGTKGATKKRIESETGAEINIPRRRAVLPGNAETADQITIQGQTRRSVFSACRKIKMLVASVRSSMKITHYISASFYKGDIVNNFIEFKKQVLSENFPGIDEELFQSDQNLHITITTFVLLDDAERSKALETLQNCRQFLTAVQVPFDVKISGLEIMNDDPSAVRVLYACVESPELQKLADCIHNLVTQSGLGNNKFNRDHVKLHLTLMNTSYRNKSNDRAANSFDARGILKQYSKFNFGISECNEIELRTIRSGSDESNRVTATLAF